MSTPVSGPSHLPEVPPAVPDEAISECGKTVAHEAHHWVWGGENPEDYWCVGVLANGRQDRDPL